MPAFEVNKFRVTMSVYPNTSSARRVVSAGDFCDSVGLATEEGFDGHQVTAVWRRTNGTSPLGICNYPDNLRLLPVARLMDC